MLCYRLTCTRTLLYTQFSFGLLFLRIWTVVGDLSEYVFLRYRDGGMRDGGEGLRMTGRGVGMSEGVENRGDCKKKTSYGVKRSKQRR